MITHLKLFKIHHAQPIIEGVTATLIANHVTLHGIRYGEIDDCGEGAA